MGKFFVSALLFILIAGSADAVVIRIGSGSGPAESVLLPLQKAYETETGNKLDIRYIGPDQAWKELQNGTVDVAFSGMTLGKWKQLMDERKIVITDPTAYAYRMIYEDHVVAFGHPQTTPTDIPPDLLGRLFSGETSTWKGLGPQDVPVTVILSKLATGTTMMFRERFMAGKELTKGAVWVDSFENVVNAVLKTPGALGFSSRKVLQGKPVRVLDSYEILRPIAAMVKGQSSPEVNNLLLFLKEKAKTL
jgi:ABC-type phosphate transport system substrate-binding protein